MLRTFVVVAHRIVAMVAAAHMKYPAAVVNNCPTVIDRRIVWPVIVTALDNGRLEFLVELNLLQLKLIKSIKTINLQYNL